MLLRQLFDRESCTYTYLVADPASGDALLIDPVRELLDRDLQLLQELDLALRYTLETHVHADHVTSAAMLRERTGSRIVLSKRAEARGVDLAVQDGQRIELGSQRLEVLATPGHTDTCVSYRLPEQRVVFTGDALFVRGCGRTDFQQGDPRTLYRSVHGKLLSLPGDTCIYPAHDYKGRTCSTVAEELAHNPRLGGGRSEDDFVGIMNKLDLSPPAKMAEAVPANLRCGAPEPRRA